MTVAEPLRKRVGRGLAICVLLLGILALCAEYFFPALSRLIPGTPAPSPLGAAGLVVLGIGLMAQTVRRHAVAIFAALLVIAIALTAGVRFGFTNIYNASEPVAGDWLALFSRVTPNVAIGFLCAGLALLLGSSRYARRNAQLAATMLAALLFALGALDLFGSMTGISPGIGWGLARTMPPATALGLAMIGLAILLIASASLRGNQSEEEYGTLDAGGLMAALIVLAVAVGATALSWRIAAGAVERQTEQRFEQSFATIASALTSLLQESINLLNSAQGLFAASAHVEAQEWRGFFAHLDLQKGYPGVRAAGFAPRVRGDESAKLASALSAEGALFSASPDPEREIVPILYLEPGGSIPGIAAGFELSSEPTIARALEQVIASNAVVMSGRLKLNTARDGGAVSGLALVGPVNRGRSLPEFARQLQPGISGFVFCLIDVRDWIAPISEKTRSKFWLELYDADSARPDALLYADPEYAVEIAGRRFEKSQTVVLAGRTWTLRARAAAGFLGAARSHLATLVLIGGLLASGLLFLITWILAGARSHAIAVAQRIASELSRSQLEHRAVTDTAHDAIITISGTGNILYLNPSGERLFGWSARELLGKSMTVLIPELERKQRMDDLLAFAISEQSPVVGRTSEMLLIDREGTKLPVEISASTWRIGDQDNFTAIVRDIRDRKRSENALAEKTRELERSNSELEQFAYVASHDLQEPLRMVASYVQLLSRRYKGKLDQDADEFIAFALDGATRMQQLIQDLLTFARVGSRGSDLQPIDAQDCVDRALSNLRDRLRESKATVEVGAMPQILADAGQVVQLLQNLIGNAVKFHGEHKPLVRVNAVADGEHWRFSVCDNGIGIDPQFEERIFVIFQRLHSRQDYAGTGIGLAICKKIVDRHGGRIWVESQLGEGACFYFTLAGTGDLT